MTTDKLPAIEARDAQRRVHAGEAVLIDVRDPSERRRVRIAGARSVPLDRLGAADFGADRGKAAIFHCQTGMRTGSNGARLRAAGVEEAFVLAGGIEGWRAAGLPLVEDRTAPIEIMRQMQITVGSIIVLGVVLALVVSPWFWVLPAFCGLGLVFAGVTGFCGMSRLLAYLPWNRAAA
ncbi:MAG: rhodanese family protein [Alphaproteobacteria bacterium]